MYIYLKKNEMVMTFKSFQIEIYPVYNVCVIKCLACLVWILIERVCNMFQMVSFSTGLYVLFCINRRTISFDMWSVVQVCFV